MQIYTAICGGYERAREDVLVFRDSPVDKFRDPVMNAKPYKLLPHLYVAAPYRIWVDGNVFPLKDPAVTVAELLGDSDIAVHKHPWRNCIYAEHPEARARLDRRHWPLIDEQVRNYRAEGMPERYGLCECGVILSRDSAITREFFERWWAEVTRYTSRDQMSFPYVWWKMRERIRIHVIRPARNGCRFGQHFRLVPHGN